MKEIVVISGKGGTGKTVFSGALATFFDNKVLADCDVDASDLHLLTEPKILETIEFRSGKTAFIDEKKCSQCGLCERICRFDAIKNFRVDEISCEGCAFCYHICPMHAIEMKINISGHIFISETRFGDMVFAKLGAGEENSGKLVSKVKEEARKFGKDLMIVDGSPGIGCQVISSIGGANIVVIITEPTMSGIHDLERVLKVCQYFQIDSKIVINKYDLNSEMANEIIEKFGDKILGKISFDKSVLEAVSNGETILESKVVSNEFKKNVLDICSKLKKEIELC
jgi:MinD superfamily P-loop ATPase